MLGKFAACALVIALVSCGGGGGGGGAGGGGVPPAPQCPSGYLGTPPNCTTPATGTTSFTTSTAGVQVAVPPVSGFGGTMSIPPADTAAPMVLYSFATAPDGIPVVQAARRRMTPAPNTPYVYYILQANAPVTLQGMLSFALTVPTNVPPAQTYYIAALADDFTWFTIAGPGTVAGGKVTFTIPLQIEYTQAGLAIALALYAGHPVYSGTPLIAAPTTVVLMDLTATQPVSLIDNDPNATVSIDSSGCSGIASVMQSSATTFTFSAVAIGTCQVTATDSNGHSISIPVNVQTTQVIVQ